MKTEFDFWGFGFISLLIGFAMGVAYTLFIIGRLI